MIRNDYIEFLLKFREQKEEMDFNEYIEYNEFNNSYIERVIITPTESSNQAIMKIELSVEFCKKNSSKEILIQVNDFILEFLLKFSLDLNILFPFYTVNTIHISEKIEIHDNIGISEKLILIKKICKKSDIDKQDIKFYQHKEKYLKMIRILSLVEMDPIVVYLILYDWFLEWVVPINKNKKQSYVKNYITDNIDDLTKNGIDNFRNKEYWFSTNQEGKNEDIFTKIRNDISHSAERVKEENINNLSNLANTLIIPLIYVMMYYLKNNIENDN